jgi:anti-sigma-K factor RskA
MTDAFRPDHPGVPDLTCDEVRDLAGSFVLGALDADEAEAVRAHLAGCADAHAEIAELASVVPVLDASVPIVEPPSALKGRIMAAATEDLATRRAATDTAAVTDTATVTDMAAVPSSAEPIPISSRRSTGSLVLRIAAVLAIVLLGGWNLLLQGQLSAAEAYEQSVAAVLEVAAQPGSLTAVLTADGAGGASGPAGLAAVSSAGEVTLAMQDLEPTSGAQVYEAWVIGGDGVPVPLGSFAVGGNGTASFAASGLPAEPGIVLALTLEPGPGATTPTLPIVSAGTATAAG